MSPSSNGFQVEQIDHVELTVSDRYEAAEWYRRVFGLEIVPEFKFWAEDPRGPLMISTPHGNTKLALFAGEPQGSQRNVGYHLVAFRVGAEAFINFVDLLPSLNLQNQAGESLTAAHVTDHQRAFSIYFCDPHGNQLELTTYDHEQVKRRLGR